MNPAADDIPPRRLWAEWLLILIFAALLWLPTVDYFTGLDRTQPPGENRLPAPKPHLGQFNLAGAQKYTVACEVYFNDHFGFRKRLIRWFQQWKQRLYHDQSVNKVIVGRDHWLFSGEQLMVEHFLGLAKFTPAQLKSWQTLLEKRRDWLGQRGTKYLFVIAPDKQSIYPEQLPVWLVNAAPTNRETKLDQFLKYMQANSTVEILDLRGPLVAAKQTRPIYLQGDSHWNMFGSFVACQALIQTLTQRLPALPPLRGQDFIWTNTPDTGGDLARMAGAEAGEKNSFQFQPATALPALRMTEDLHFKSNWGIKKVVTVENPAATNRVVVLFHDSFGGSWPPFLGLSFKRAVFELDNHEFCPALIASNAPDVVINEILERYFDTADPEEMIAKDALP